MTAFAAIPTRGPSDALRALLAEVRQVATPIVLHPPTGLTFGTPEMPEVLHAVKEQMRFPAWHNQGRRIAEARGGDVFLFLNDDLVAPARTFAKMIDTLRDGTDLVSLLNDDYRGQWGQFSGDIFGHRLDAHLWMDEQFHFHHADADLQYRAHFLGRSHRKLAGLPLERHAPGWKNNDDEWDAVNPEDRALFNARWGWFLWGPETLR